MKLKLLNTDVLIHACVLSCVYACVLGALCFREASTLTKYTTWKNRAASHVTVRLKWEGKKAQTHKFNNVQSTLAEGSRGLFERWLTVKETLLWKLPASLMSASHHESLSPSLWPLPLLHPFSCPFYLPFIAASPPPPSMKSLETAEGSPCSFVRRCCSGLL